MDIISVMNGLLIRLVLMVSTIHTQSGLTVSGVMVSIHVIAFQTVQLVKST